MILYHGTNCDVRKPDPRKGHRGTDFGQGFYLTPDMMLSIMKDRPWRVMQYSFHTARSVRFLKLKEIWHEQ